MNVIILYEQLNFALKAKWMLERAARHADPRVACVFQPWRCDLLRLPEVTEESLREAAGAQVVAVALKRQTKLPPAALGWLEQWARRRQVEDAALAVFEGGIGDTNSAPPDPRLFRLAQRHGLIFIFGGGHLAMKYPGAAAGGTKESDNRKAPFGPMPATNITDNLPPPVRHWGINE